MRRDGRISVHSLTKNWKLTGCQSLQLPSVTFVQMAWLSKRSYRPGAAE